MQFASNHNNNNDYYWQQQQQQQKQKEKKMIDTFCSKFDGAVDDGTTRSATM